MIKLIAADLDDTLLTTDKKITDHTRAVLAECQNRGIEVVAASGRFTESILVFLKMIGLGLEKRPQLGNGGGSVFTEDRILQEMNTFDLETYGILLERTRSLGVPCVTINGENMYYDIEDQPLVDIYRHIEKQGRRPYVVKTADLMQVKNPFKLVYWYRDLAEKEKIMSLTHPDTVNFSSGRAMREITMKDLNKWNGMQALAKIYGVQPSEIACFGDSENDISMLKGAGLGCAVANAMDNVKEAADLVGEKTNDEDGVAWMIEKYIL